jgi:hypothetical protein
VTAAAWQLGKAPPFTSPDAIQGDSNRDERDVVLGRFLPCCCRRWFFNAFVEVLQARIDRLEGAASAKSQQESAKLERCRRALLSKGPHVPSFGFLGGECIDVLPMDKPPHG